MDTEAFAALRRSLGVDRVDEREAIFAAATGVLEELGYGSMVDIVSCRWGQLALAAPASVAAGLRLDAQRIQDRVNDRLAAAVPPVTALSVRVAH